MYSTVGVFHDKCGRYLEYCGGVQYHGGYHEYLGVILSTVGDSQYRGGYHDACGGYHEHRENLVFFEYPTVLNTPWYS